MKALIVEDEPLEARSIRLLLEKYYPREVDAILQAGDGENAVRLAKEERPDLILMDIHLPGMNGVAASRAIRAMDEDVEIIMLTAYADFEYAKLSIGNRVLDYVVKPYSAGTFREVMDRAVECVGGKRRVRAELEEAHALAEMLRREFLHKILVNFRLRREIIRRYAQMIGVHEKRYRILFLESDEVADAGGSALEDLLAGLRGAGLQCMSTRFTRMACVIPYAERTAELAGPVDRVLAEWRRKRRCGTCLAGAVEKQWEDIAVRFHELFARLINRDGPPGEEPGMDALEESLGEAVISRDGERAAAVCRKLVDAAYRLYGTSNDFGYALIAGYRGLVRSVQALERGTADGGAEDFAPGFNIPYRGDREAAFADLNAAVGRLVARLDDGVHGNASRLIRLVKQYIALHYAENITLEALARHVSLSRFHLSRMFRTHENETIVGHLRKVRVENAKRVLLAGGSASEACYKCGFSDPAYFGKTFKRLTGTSPACFAGRRAK